MLPGCSRTCAEAVRSFIIIPQIAHGGSDSRRLPGSGGLAGFGLGLATGLGGLATGWALDFRPFFFLCQRSLSYCAQAAHSALPSAGG